VDQSLAVLSLLAVAKYIPIGLHLTSQIGFSWHLYATIFVSVSKDHNRVVASAEHDKRYFGGAAGPLTGSKATEYTGPLCPMSLRVELPFFSRILARDVTKTAVKSGYSIYP
jgi:hypothetical protein